MSYGVNYKIPIIERNSEAGSYKKIPFDLKNPRSAEPLVKFSDFGIACDDFAARSICGDDPYKEKIGGATQYVWGRETVAEKLARVNVLLRPSGVEVMVWDAYRSIESQRFFWDYYLRQAARRLPQASEEERRRYAVTLVSDPTGFSPSDSTTWPIHVCGGAVDLGLRDLKTGEFPDISAGFNEKGRIPHSDALERKLQAHEITEDDPRLLRRRLLHWAMAQEGFINCPFEYWHFDYGDQMYVLYSQLVGLPNAPKEAWYGYVESPESEG
ncbi:MAG: M15 family metallopeptidase [Bdellovibrionales bacterium]